MELLKDRNLFKRSESVGAQPTDMRSSSTLSAGTFAKLKWMRFKVDGAAVTNSWRRRLRDYDNLLYNYKPLNAREIALS